ncbi:MAG: carboxypeptidase regulatory-like domain-containing protein [Acidobacteria bacterium]|nr:carboxypeptidase regulatory-like domain-containing protein [Acidobacteriota bacterium]MCA1619889.1 carboxypeptidase regulatory-like domain-containing protein [Acidobacteriota bacterium]
MKAKLFLLVLILPCLCAPDARGQRRARAAAAGAAPERTTPRAGATQTLPIRRVTLYSNGVAYIERRGTVTGHAEVDLSFKQSQVDDVLKSMVVLDLGRGRVGAVSYNSSAPPSARMADIPFSISPATAGPSGGLAGVLGQLQGARVAVTTSAGRTASGSVLTVEERRTQPDPQKPPTITHELVVASEGGELQSFDLAEVRAVRLLDEGTRRDVGEFAAASASARRRDAKTITVTSDGAGPREMLVSYTVAAPIWKTTYRVVLDAEGRPFFQGWAIVDNVSDEDWAGVQLSLISGMPVSFIQPIQKPFYRYRPVIPMPDDLRLSPQVYEPDSGEVGGGNRIVGSVEDPNGAMVAGAEVTITNASTGQRYTARTDSEGVFRAQGLAAGLYNVSVESPGFSRTDIANVRVGPERAASIGISVRPAGVQETVTVSADALPAARVNNLMNLPVNGRSNNFVADGTDTDERAGLKPEPTLSARLTGGESGVVAAAEGGEVGDLFEYKIEQPVTVRRDRSALIPILQTRMEGSRVSVYNQSAGRSRPMSGMLLKNTSRLTLEGGALTVIDGDAYAGEALLERLKPEEKRLVSFALDLGTLVTVRDAAEDSPAFAVRIAHGTLYATHHHRVKKVYTLRNQTERARTVYVEHPVRQGWELDDKLTPAPEGKSQSFYRFRVELPAGETRELLVAERERGIETYALSNVTHEQIQLFVARRYIDDATRAALQNILDLKARLASTRGRVAAVDREMAEIAADQRRLRENIEALAKTPEARQLITRYVQKAGQQETRLEQLAREKQEADAERARLQAQLDSALRALALERDLAMKVDSRQ